MLSVMLSLEVSSLPLHTKSQVESKLSCSNSKRTGETSNEPMIR
jgi:hypothetical protein